MIEGYEGLSNFLKKMVGRKIKIMTKASLYYTTQDFSVSNEAISFKDKFGNHVIVALSEISQVTDISQEIVK